MTSIESIQDRSILADEIARRIALIVSKKLLVDGKIPVYLLEFLVKKSSWLEPHVNNLVAQVLTDAFNEAIPPKESEIIVSKIEELPVKDENHICPVEKLTYKKIFFF